MKDRPFRPAFALAALTGINLFNYLDRQILPAVLTPLKEDLHLSDSRLGTLQVAFMLGYFLTAPFFGYLGDRMSRKGLIIGGVLVWSVGTVLSGWAPSLVLLLLFRIVVGLGEASYGSISPGWIADLYPPARRNLPISVFYVAIPVGSALGYIIGGIMAAHFGWRVAFVWAGAPGLLVALSLLFLHEPARGASDEIVVTEVGPGGAPGRAVLGDRVGSADGVGPGGAPGRAVLGDRVGSADGVGPGGRARPLAPSTLGSVSNERPGATAQPHLSNFLQTYARLRDHPDYLLVVAGYVAQNFAMGGFAFWAPTFLHRVHGLDLEQADRFFGGWLVLTGLAATLLGGFAATALGRRSPAGYARLLAVSAIAVVPATFAAFALGSRGPAEVALVLAMFLIFLPTGPINTLILETVPVAQRACAMAASIFAIHLFGDLWSPKLIGILSDRWGSLREAALYTLPAATAVSAIFWAWLAIRQARRSQTALP